MKQQDLINQRKEILAKQADVLGIDLGYEPEVVMEDISKAPEFLWHKARRTGWGGSDEGALNGMGYSSLESTAMTKVLGVKEKVSDDLQHIFDFGHANEWIMLKAYAVRNGYKYLTYSNYFIVVKTNDDVSKYPFLVRNGEEDGQMIYTAKYSSEQEANIVLASVIKDFPNTTIIVEEGNDPKDLRDITEEEHKKYDAQGIVCVDRKQYRVGSMLGDTDGVAITPSGERIGIECKTYSHQKSGSFTSGLLGEEGVKIKNPEYALQVAHYMHVLNLDRFDIVSLCGNLPDDIQITTVIRDLQLEQELVTNCERQWKAVQECEIPEANSISDEEFNKLVEMLTQKPKKADVGELSDDNLDIINEIESLNEEIKRKTKEIENLKSDANVAKLKLVKAMQEGNSIYEKALVHENGFDYLVTALPSEQKKLDEKKLKANCPELYAEYEKSKSFNKYIEKCEPDVRAEYDKCLVSSPKVKITKVKTGSSIA